MKAIIWKKYGRPESLELKEVVRPEPKDNEVLIKIHATTVTAGDCELRRLKFGLFLKFMLRLYFGFLKPRERALGQELSGEIIEVGSEVKRFKAGDKIMATTGLKFGAYAEYVCLNAKGNAGVIELKPNNMSYDEAAGLPVGGMEALHSLRVGHLKKNQKLLINGAGGSIGTAAIQMVKYIGAHVTAVDSKDKHDILLEAGADRVIDYKTVDYTKLKDDYDMIFDVIGKAKYISSLNRLSKNGFYVVGNPRLSLKLRGKITNLLTQKQVITTTAVQKIEDLRHLKKLVEDNHLKVLIDKKYPLEEMVLAHNYVESGKKKGNLIINVINERSM